MQEDRHCKDMKLKEKGRYSTVRDIHQGIAIGILNMMIQEWNKSPGKQEQRKKEKQEYGGRKKNRIRGRKKNRNMEEGG